MMKGSNQLLLCQAEVIRAIEYYLNEVQFKERVEVTSVTENSNDHNFCVSLADGGLVLDAGDDDGEN